MKKIYLQCILVILFVCSFKCSNAQDGIHFVNNAAPDSISINKSISDTTVKVNDSSTFNIPIASPNIQNTKKNIWTKMNEKGFSISGSAGLQLGYYVVSGIPKRLNPFTYQLTGDITFKYKDIIALPFSIVLNDQTFKYHQPFNQFGLSPQYKWLTVHGGFRNVNWSENSLAGQNMLMIGAEVHPSYFRGGILFGRLNKVYRADSTKLDSLQLQTFVPTYKRLGMAVKLGAGTEKNYVDLIYFRAWDKGKDVIMVKDENGNEKVLTQSENAVFNIVTSNKIGKYITIKADYALSTTNVDRSLTKNKDSVSSDYPKIAGILIKPNRSAIGGHAASADLLFEKEGWNTNAGFKLSTRDFNSFGAYFLQTNYYNVYIRQIIPLQNQKARLSIYAQMLDDNLNKKKPFSTRRAIIQTGYDFNGAKFGISAQYLMAYSKQKALTDSIKNSTFNDLLLNQLNHTFFVIPRYLIIKGNKTHMIMLSEIANFLTDFNKNTEDNTKYFNNVINLSYTLNIPLKYFSLTGALINTYVKNKTLTVASYGTSVSTNEGFAKNKVNISDAVAYTYSKLANIVNFNLTLSYSPEKHHKLYLTDGLIWNGSKTSTAPSFTELRGTVGYLYTF